MEFLEKIIYVNNEEKKLPASGLLEDVIKAYWDTSECDTYFVKLNGQTINSILNDDDVVVNEGDKIEPLFYVPVISNLFLNGSNGISTGFRQVILPRNVNEVIEYIKKKINGTEHPRMSLLPYWKNFKGSTRQTSDGGIEILGCVEQVNTTTYKITELPVMTGYVNYCKFLDRLEEDGIIQSWKDLCDPKTNELLFEVKTTREFTRSHNDVESLYRVFHLAKPFTECYNCIDENNRVREFSSIHEILDTFIEIRLKYYGLRKQHLLDSLTNELKKLVSKYHFCDGIIKKTIKVAMVKKDDIIAQLKKVPKIIECDGSYNYLLNMPIHSISKDTLDELKKQIFDAQAEFKKIQGTSVETMWTDDLHELKKVL